VERATATGRASSTDVRAKARRAAELQAKLEAPDEATEHPFPAVEERPQSFGLPLPAFPAGKVEYDRADDRLRIHFDERQGKDGTRALKGDGWRWSRRNTAWQRQLTNNAVWSASRLLGIDLPSLDTSALQQAEDEAARKVQEARKARKAAAREGEGTFWDVLDAAMRKGSQFKLLLPKDIDSPKAGKKVSPSMSTWKSWGRSAPGFNFIYRTKEAGRSKWSPGGRLVIAMLKNLGDGQWQVRAFTNPYYPNESWVEGKDVTFTMPDSPTAEDVPTAVAAFKKLITSFGDLSNVPKL